MAEAPVRGGADDGIGGMGLGNGVEGGIATVSDWMSAGGAAATGVGSAAEASGSMDSAAWMLDVSTTAGKAEAGMEVSERASLMRASLLRRSCSSSDCGGRGRFCGAVGISFGDVETEWGAEESSVRG